MFLLETRSDPLFAVLAIDAGSYHDLALRFAGGDRLFGTAPLWFAPLYPVLLGLLYTVVGPLPLVARLLQLLAGAGAAWLVWRTGGRISRTVGLVAGLAMALSPVLVYYENQLLYTSLAVLLTAGLVAAWLRAVETSAPGRSAVVAGLLLGALGLVRTNALVLLPVLAIDLARRRGPRRALLLVLATALPFAPVLARNGLVAGTWTPLTVNGGMIFATGFAEDAVGGRAMLRRPSDFGPDGAWHREAERGTGRTMTLAEASAWHRDAALARIRARPGWVAALTLRKLALLASAREFDDNLGFPAVRDRSLTLGLWPAPWAWLFPLGVAGAFLAAGRKGPAGDTARRMAILVAAWAASLLLAFVNARYRLPLVVPLALLAGIAVDRAREVRRTRAAGRSLTLGAVAGVVALGLALRDPGVRPDPVLERIGLAAALERDGRHEEALRYTDLAIAADPGVPGAWQNRALSLRALGRVPEALDALDRALALDPSLFEAWMTRGTILAEAGRVDAAVPSFRRAVALRPDHPDALANLAQALAVTGATREAVDVGRRAIARGAARLAPAVERWTRETEGRGEGAETASPPAAGR